MIATPRCYRSAGHRLAVRAVSLLSGVRITLPRLGLFGLLYLLAFASPAAMLGYASNATGIYGVNVANGATSLIYSGAPFDGVTAVAALAQRASDGQLFFLSDGGSGNQRVYRWDPATPASPAVLLGRTGASVPYILRLASHLVDGNIYALNQDGTVLYTLDQSTGAATVTASITGWPGVTSGDIAFEPGSNRLLGATYNPAAARSELYEIPLSGGAVTFIGTVSGLPSGGQAITALMIDFNRRIFCGGNLSTILYSFANTGGAAVAVGNMGVGVFDFGSVPAPAPTVLKSINPALVAPGQDSTLTLTLSSTFGSPTRGLTVTDTYPAGLVNAPTPAVTNTCLGTVTATAGTGSLVLTGGTLPANGLCTITVKVRAANAGSYVNTVVVGGLSTILSFNDVEGSATLVVGLPAFSLTKTSAVVSDPVNGGSNPKRIPGGLVSYTLTLSNSGSGTQDAGSVVLVDPIPADTALFVGDLGSAGSGPVSFVQGSPASGLSYSYSGLASATDDLSFSKDGGVSFNYTPVPAADGTDATVTHLRINPKGVMASAAGAGNPNFSAQFRVRIK